MPESGDHPYKANHLFNSNGAPHIPGTEREAVFCACVVEGGVQGTVITVLTHTPHFSPNAMVYRRYGFREPWEFPQQLLAAFPVWKGRMDCRSPPFYVMFLYLPYGTPVFRTVLCFVRTHGKLSSSYPQTTTTDAASDQSAPP
jgi:hypothetical protein